jgi:hypothetical protein
MSDDRPTFSEFRERAKQHLIIYWPRNVPRADPATETLFIEIMAALALDTHNRVAFMLDQELERIERYFGEVPL